MKAFGSFLKDLVRADSLESSKSFTLVTAAIVGGLVGIAVIFCLVWDVVHNGYIRTDLESLGIFMLCVGGYVAGNSVSKAMAEIRKKKDPGTTQKQ